MYMFKVVGTDSEFLLQNVYRFTNCGNYSIPLPLSSTPMFGNADEILSFPKRMSVFLTFKNLSIALEHLVTFNSSNKTYQIEVYQCVEIDKREGVKYYSLTPVNVQLSLGLISGDKSDDIMPIIQASTEEYACYIKSLGFHDAKHISDDSDDDFIDKRDEF